MTIVTVLENLGFTKQDAEFLGNHRSFHHKTKDETDLLAVFQKIAEIYTWELNIVKKAILKFPVFAGLNHERVIREASAVYGNEAGVKKAILKHPAFAGLDHGRVVREASAVYRDEARVKKAILKHPAFANLDHGRVVREASAVYGNEAGVKKAILKFPAFANLDHKRVLRERIRVGKLAGMNKQETIDTILKDPVLAGYSAKRYIAALDVARTLKEEGFAPDEKMLSAFFRYRSVSPYVPGFERRRISQIRAGHPEPPLLKKMRGSLRRNNLKS